MTAAKNLPTHMSVELLDHMGDDMAIVDAARVSYSKHGTWEYRAFGNWKELRGLSLWFAKKFNFSRRISKKDVGLINFMARERHGTPFEMVQFRFRVRVPIGVAREFLRHRIGSFNEESSRYVQMRPHFYVPRPQDMRKQVGKPGAYTFEPVSERAAASASEIMTRSYANAYADYEELLELGIAKEVARNVLPLGLYTEFIWSVNLRSLSNFLSLRTAPNALREIVFIADEIENIVKTIIPVTYAAWNKYDRKSL